MYCSLLNSPILLLLSSLMSRDPSILVVLLLWCLCLVDNTDWQRGLILIQLTLFSGVLYHEKPIKRTLLPFGKIFSPSLSNWLGKGSKSSFFFQGFICFGVQVRWWYPTSCCSNSCFERHLKKIIYVRKFLKQQILVESFQYFISAQKFKPISWHATCAVVCKISWFHNMSTCSFSYK